jgi:hypothetical protein
LDLTKCQGTRWNGDNPFDGFWVPTLILIPPTFYHRNGYGDIVMTTFFPLTLSGGPFFYYIRFPDNKGTLSVEGGETTVGSVIEGFYPPPTREPIYYLDPNEVTTLRPFVVETSHSGGKWENNGLSNYRP